MFASGMKSKSNVSRKELDKAVFARVRMDQSTRNPLYNLLRRRGDLIAWALLWGYVACFGRFTGSFFLIVAVNCKAIWTQFHAYAHSPRSFGVLSQTILRIYSVGTCDLWRKSHQVHHKYTYVKGKDVDIPIYESIKNHKIAVLTVPILLIKECSALCSVSDVVQIVVFLTLRSILIGGLMTPVESLAGAFINSCYVGVTFGLSHMVETEYSATLELSFMNTCNITSIWLPQIVLDEIFGGINYHIEHHMYPTLDWYDLKLIQPILRRFADEHGYPYREIEWFDFFRQIRRAAVEQATSQRRVQDVEFLPSTTGRGRQSSPTTTAS